MKKLEFLNARKRTAVVTVSFEELENILPDDRISPEVEAEELGSIISAFLRQEKERLRYERNSNLRVRIGTALLGKRGYEKIKALLKKQ